MLSDGGLWYSLDGGTVEVCFDVRLEESLLRSESTGDVCFYTWN